MATAPILSSRAISAEWETKILAQAVDLGIGAVDPALEEGLVVPRPRRGELLVQCQHPLDQRDHLVIPRLVGRVGEVDRADGASLPRAGVKDRQADQFVPFVSEDDVVVRQFAVGGAGRLLEVDVENIRLGVV